MVDETPNLISILTFKGYSPDLAVPSPDALRELLNMNTDVVDGELHARGGQAHLYSSGATPAVSNVSGGVEYNSLLVKSRKDAGEIVARESFYVRDQGGQTIDVVMMKYHHEASTSAAADFYSYGIFIRPFWDGTAWRDWWQELTEFWDFEIYGVSGDWLQLDDDPIIWEFGNEVNKVFPTDVNSGGSGTENEYYFRGWTIENLAAAEAADKWCRVLQSRCTATATGGEGILEILLPADAYTDLTWAVGNKIRLHRNYVDTQNRISTGDDIVCDPHFLILDDGMRISNGVGTNKGRFYLGYQQHANEPMAVPKEQIANGIILCDQFIEPHQLAGFVAINDTTSDLTSTLPAGTYHVAYSWRQGRNWSKLYDCPEWDAVNSRYDADGVKPVVVGADEQIRLDLFISPALLSRAITAVRVYIEDVTEPGFLRVLEIDLTLPEIYALAAEGAVLWWDGTTEYIGHGFQQIQWPQIYIPGVELATVDIGRAETDSGAGYWNTAGRVGLKVIYSDVMIGGVQYQNRLHVSPAGGDGQVQSDIIASDVLNYIYMTQADPFRVVGIVGIDDRALVLTSGNSFILNLRGPKSSWLYELLTSDDGCVAEKSIVEVDRRIFWAGNYGVYAFSLAENRRILTANMKPTYLAFNGKDGFMAGYDFVRGRYCLYMDDQFFCFPARGPRSDELEVSKWQVATTPVWVSRTPIGRLSWVSDNGDMIVGSDAGLEIDGGATFPCLVETGYIRLPDPLRVDQVIDAVDVEYESDSEIEVGLFLNNETSLFSTRTLPVGAGHKRLFFALSARCKEARLNFSSDVTPGDTLKIKRVAVHRQLVPAWSNQ